MEVYETFGFGKTNLKILFRKEILVMELAFRYNLGSFRLYI